jgi:two-component system phosphate regulon sensor histidine kinase PhoR
MALAVIVAGFGFMVWAMRRERRLSELKSDFISNVSHELKTPLSIISMFGELLSMGRARTPEQTAEYAEIIRRESVRLSRLIDNVLDFSKIERGVDVYEFADGEDLGEIVSRALEISSHRLDSAELELEVEIEDDLPTARLDANAMTLAVLNLVDNAIKYAADGGKVVVSVRRDEAGSSPAIVLEVRDFGPGVPAEERDQIFERFYRARSVRLKPIRGSGIGLALVRHIAEAHGGSIAALDADGGGACFRLRVPA